MNKDEFMKEILNEDEDYISFDEPEEEEVTNDTEEGEDWTFAYVPEKEKVKRQYFLIPLLIAVIIIIILLMRGCAMHVSDDGTRFFDLTFGSEVEKGKRETLSEEEIIEALNDAVEQGMMNISMNLAPVFETGTAKGTLYISNAETNKLPQVIEIVRDDTGDVIYTSSCIMPGSRVDTDELDVPLNAGVYDCTAFFNGVDAETGECLGRAAAKITITVLG